MVQTTAKNGLNMPKSLKITVQQSSMALFKTFQKLAESDAFVILRDHLSRSRTHEGRYRILSGAVVTVALEAMQSSIMFYHLFHPKK